MSTTEDIHSDHIEDGDADNEVRSPSPSVSDRVQDVETMQARLAELEAEAQKIREMQESVDKEHSALSTQDKKEDVDARSVFVGNVDYAATPEELQAHFASCGTILRVTILCDKVTGHPKGYGSLPYIAVLFVFVSPPSSPPPSCCLLCCFLHTFFSSCSMS